MSSAIVTITVAPQYLRSLDQFENRKELLYALSDAIARKYLSWLWSPLVSHYFFLADNERKWMASGVVHGNINLDMIRIGNMHGPPGTRGVLVDNQHSLVSFEGFLVVIDVTDISIKL